MFFSGNYLGPATFGSTNVVGSNAAFLVKYDIIGTQQWVKTVTGGGIVVVSGKCLTSNLRNEIAMGSVFTMYGGVISFEGSAITLSCNGGPGNYGSGYYVAKLGNCTMVANAGSDASINCSDTVMLAASGGTVYSWSPSTGLNTTTNDTVLAHPVVTTDYIVTVSDSTGCNANDTVRVTVTGGPVIVVTGDTSICEGLSTQLIASGANTYSWLPITDLDNASIYNPTATPGNTITYTVTGTDIYGCATSLPVTITVNPLPAIPTITPNLNVFTSSPATTYQWNLNGGPIAGATNQVYTALSNGIYTVTVTDSNGCERTSAPYLFNSLGVSELQNNNFISSIPNPLTHDVDIILNSNSNLSNPHLRITDAVGRVITDEYFAARHLILRKQGLANGVYFYSLIDNERIIVSDKLIVE